MFGGVSACSASDCSGEVAILLDVFELAADVAYHSAAPNMAAAEKADAPDVQKAGNPAVKEAVQPVTIHGDSANANADTCTDDGKANCGQASEATTEHPSGPGRDADELLAAGARSDFAAAVALCTCTLRVLEGATEGPYSGHVSKMVRQAVLGNIPQLCERCSTSTAGFEAVRRAFRVSSQATCIKRRSCDYDSVFNRRCMLLTRS